MYRDISALHSLTCILIHYSRRAGKHYICYILLNLSPFPKVHIPVSDAFSALKLLVLAVLAKILHLREQSPGIKHNNRLKIPTLQSFPKQNPLNLQHSKHQGMKDTKVK